MAFLVTPVVQFSAVKSTQHEMIQRERERERERDRQTDRQTDRQIDRTNHCGQDIEATLNLELRESRKRLKTIEIASASELDVLDLDPD